MKKLRLNLIDAQALCLFFKSLPTDSKGFVDPYFLEDFRKLADKKATSRHLPYGQGMDAPVILEFKDGSKLFFANPHQAVYPAFCREY